ncbi:calcium-binding protein [Methylobacterium sp. CM6244]
MASVSFTYNGDFDENNIVRLAQNGLIYHNNLNNPHAFGPQGGDKFIINSTGNLSDGGTFFTDADRFDQDPILGDLYERTIVGGSYSVNIDLSDNVGLVTLVGSNFGDILRAGSGDDILNGGGGNDVLEGGLGLNSIDGGLGLNTLTYESYVSLDNRGIIANFDVGIAQSFARDLQDLFSNINNLIGSSYDDAILGSSGNNILNGGAGSDELYGREGNDTLYGGTGADSLSGDLGNDRLVIEETPGFVSGGGDKDFLFVAGGGSVSLTESTFREIEAVYVRNDTRLDMSAVDTGTRIASQSTAGHGVEIIGTAGADRIVAGKGGDVIEGGTGGDRLLAGSGADTFHFQTGFGRDNVIGFDVATDHITVDIAGATGVTLKEFHGGQDTIVTFVGVEGTNKIILHDVTMAELQTGPSDLFTFGA